MDLGKIGVENERCKSEAAVREVAREVVKRHKSFHLTSPCNCRLAKRLYLARAQTLICTYAVNTA